MRSYFQRLRTSPIWLKLAFIVLGVLWGYWLSGTWPTNPVMEYTLPHFESLEIIQGTLSFTRRSKSSGGDIEIHTRDGKKLILACNPPNTLPDACYRKMLVNEWRDFRKDITGKEALVWWHRDADVPHDGRAYQMQVGNDLFFTYQDQVDYYQKHYQKGGGRSGIFGLILLLATVFVIYASLNKEG